MGSWGVYLAQRTEGSEPSLWGVQRHLVNRQLVFFICPTWVVSTHLPELLIHCSEAQLHPRAARLLGNTLRADYSPKLVWGDPAHLSWGDVVVWKSNRPFIPKPNKSNWGFGFSCCWNYFTFLSGPSFHTLPGDFTFVLSQFLLKKKKLQPRVWDKNNSSNANKNNLEKYISMWQIWH